MPFEAHKEFLPPDDPTARIWRYMDVAKYLSILERRALFFVRMDRLAPDDPFEGYYTDANLAADNVSYEDVPERLQRQFADKNAFESMKAVAMAFRSSVKNQRKGTFVSSWHIQEHESAAMWSQYIRSADGIALQSSYTRLVDSLSGYEDFLVHIGRVRYLNYEVEALPIWNGFIPYMHKRLSFEHERELRALIWTYQHGKNNLANNKYENIYGLYVPIDLGRLVESVYVSPTAPRWIVELVESVSKRYGLHVPVKQSDLSRQPLY